MACVQEIIRHHLKMVEKAEKLNNIAKKFDEFVQSRKGDVEKLYDSALASLK
jgi:hypothetical protein